MKKFLFALVITLALCLRFFHLGTIPHGLHNDELANVYGARYIFINHQDIYGNKFPLLYFDKFGDYPPVIPMYFSALGTFIFGPNELGARFFTALFGFLTVIPTYFIALLIFKKKETALFCALIAALSPWNIVLSRVSAEGIIATSVFLFGLLALLYSLKKQSIPLLIFGFILFASTNLLYPGFRIIVPLTLLPIPFLMRKDLTKAYFITLLSLIGLSFLILLGIDSTVWGKGRFAQTSIFNVVSGVQITINQLIFNEPNIFIARIFNNKIIGFVKEFILQYFSYFDLNFLFTQGGFPKLYAIPNNGLVFLSLIPIFFISFIGKFQEKNKEINHSFFLYILYLFLLSPIPAALTIIDIPSTHRSVLMGALLMIIAGYGFNTLLNFKFRKFPIFIIIFVFIAIESIYIFHNYFQHESFYTSPYRNDGNKELVQYLLKNENKYHIVYVTHEQRWLSLYYLFYKNDYNNKYTGMFSKSDFYIPRIDNLSFSMSGCPTHDLFEMAAQHKPLGVSENDLFVDDGACKGAFGDGSPIFLPVETILRVDKTTAFNILKLNPSYLQQNPHAL